MTTKSINQQSFYIAIALYESTSSNPEDRILYEECKAIIWKTMEICQLLQYFNLSG